MLETDLEVAPPKIINLAYDFGILKKDYTLQDYLLEAVKEGGYETVLIWGVQGSGKSSRLLQMLYWIYRDWNVVLEKLLFKPSTLVTVLDVIPDDERVPGLGWDDVGVHFASSKFKTDIKQYEAIDSAWAAIRTKVDVIVTTIPLIDRLAKNIKDNITFEVYLGKNQMEIIYRVFHLPGLHQMESNFFKVTLEQPRRFNLFDVPLNIWQRYWKERIRLTREALNNLKETTDMGKMSGYMTVLVAAKIARDQNIPYATTSIQQDISRGVLKGKKINGVLCVSEQDFYDNLVTKGGVSPL